MGSEMRELPHTLAFDQMMPECLRNKKVQKIHDLLGPPVLSIILRLMQEWRRWIRTVLRVIIGTPSQLEEKHGARGHPHHLPLHISR
jgi:hypothetical protein